MYTHIKLRFPYYYIRLIICILLSNYSVYAESVKFIPKNKNSPQRRHFANRVRCYAELSELDPLGTTQFHVSQIITSYNVPPPRSPDYALNPVTPALSTPCHSPCNP